MPITYKVPYLYDLGQIFNDNPNIDFGDFVETINERTGKVEEEWVVIHGYDGQKQLHGKNKPLPFGGKKTRKHKTLRKNKTLHKRKTQHKRKTRKTLHKRKTRKTLHKRKTMRRRK